jgi:hypothetical protein
MTPTLHDAVLALYTNAVWISGNDVDSLIAKDSNENLITLEKNAINSKLAELQATQTAKQEAEVAAKESALSKLTALGLTADEVKALLGVA